MKRRIVVTSLVVVVTFIALAYLAASIFVPTDHPNSARAQTTWTLTVVSDHDTPNPSVGDHTYDNDSFVACSVTSPVTEGTPSTVWTCIGWTGTGSVPPSGSGSSTSFTITDDSSITWNWQGAVVQRRLTVSSAHGSPNPGVGDHFYDDGDSATCSVSSPVVEGGHSYTCTGWSGTGDFAVGGSGTTAGPFAMSQDSSITWNWELTPWTLTVASAHGSPSPGVGPHTYSDGDSATCSVSSPVTEGSIVWTCTGWTGSGSVPSSGTVTSTGSFVMHQDSSITWNWQGAVIQRTLTVSSDHDTPSPSSGLFDDGTDIIASVTSPVSGGLGTQYVCTGWSGSGSVPASGTASSVTFTITEDSSITWNWKTQYYLTVTSPYDSPTPMSGWLDSDSSVTGSVTSPTPGPSGTQYVCTGWSGSGSVPASGTSSSVPFTITAASSITWNWKTQYYFTVSSAYDSPSPVSGWFDSASSFTESVTSPVSGGSGTQYVCTGWTGTGDVPSSGTETSADFTITQPSSITWNWKTQYYLSVSSPYDSPSPISGWFDSGSSVTESVTSPVSDGSGTHYVCTGWTGTGSVPSSGSSSSVTFTITGTSSITWSWQVIQRRLTVSSAHDSPNPSNGDHYFNDGSSVTCSVTSPVAEGGVTYVCSGWVGSGSVPSSGSGTSTGSFTITQDSSITWNWAPIKRRLTVVSAHGSPSPSVGDHFYDDGSSVTCSVISLVTEGGVTYGCTGWVGSGSVPSSGAGTSVVFTISGDSSITWNWQVVQRRLTVSSAHDSPSPGNGLHIINDGTSVTCSVSSPVTESGTIWTCTGWTGTGSVPSSGSGSSVTFTITQDSTITWNWHGNAIQHTLTVTSAHSSPSPAVGDHLYDDGDSVTCSVSSPVVDGGFSYTCTGWSGSGSVPSSGSGSSVTFTMTQDSTITWSWQVVQWALTVVSVHGSPSPGVGDHLYDGGTSVTCSVPSPVVDGGVSYTCTGWSGSGSVPSGGSDTSTTFTITENSTITWNWIVTPPVQWNLAVSSVHGSPSPDVGDHPYGDGSSVTCSVTSPVTEAGYVWTCTDWVGSGSVPSSGNGVSVTFSITQNSSITWNWVVTPSVQWKLTVVSAHDNPSPGAGDHFYGDHSSVTCSISSPVVDGGVSYTCTGWSGSGSVPSGGSDTSTTFTITENSTITWNWQVQGRPTIGSCDSAGVQKNAFNSDETVYVTGRGYSASQTYNVYVVDDTTWVDGMTIPGRIQGTATSVSSDSSGNISPTIAWNKSLTPGEYDILVDVNGNGKYDAGVDALYNSKIVTTSESSLIPEYVFGTILGLAGCFAALGAFRVYKRKRRQNI